MARRRRRRIHAGAGAGRVKAKLRFMSVYLILFGMGLLVVFTLVHTQVRGNDLRYQVKTLTRTRDRLEKENRALAALAQELSSPERITMLARSELGMARPALRRPVLLRVRNIADAAPREEISPGNRSDWFERFLSWVRPREKQGEAEG